MKAQQVAVSEGLAHLADTVQSAQYDFVAFSGALARATERVNEFLSNARQGASQGRDNASNVNIYGMTINSPGNIQSPNVEGLQRLFMSRINAEIERMGYRGIEVPHIPRATPRSK